MSDFRVQHFEVAILSTAGETDFTIPIRIDPTRTRIMLGSTMRQCQAVPPVSTTLTRDTQVGLDIVDEDTVRVYNSSNARYPVIVSFALLEYIGDPGGVNEFKVTRTRVYFPAGTNGVDLEVVGFAIAEGEESKTTTHVTGVTLDNEIETDVHGNFDPQVWVMPMVRRDPDLDTITAQQLWTQLSNIAMWVWVENVHWVGSNWTIGFAPAVANVSDVITFTTAGGSGRTVTVPATDWGSTWVEAQRGVSMFDGVVPGEQVANIYPIVTGDEVSAFAPSGAETADETANGAAFYMMSNPDIKVAHQGRGIGSTGIVDFELTDGDQPRTLQVPVNPLTATIDGPRDRVVSILHGTPKFPINQSFDDGGVQFDGDADGITFRRTFGESGWFEYIQTIQFGLEAGASGNMEDSIIRKPSWAATIRNK